MAKQSNRRGFFPVLILGLLALALVVSGCSTPRVRADEGSPGLERTITVLGRGSVSAIPELALTSVGVETFAETVGEATEANNTTMQAVIEKLKSLGIADKDIQTSNFSINSERQGPEGTDYKYRVTNMVQIKVRDLSKVSEVLDAAIEAGANQVWGVSFTIENQDDLEDEARGKAVEDARRRAKALAELSDLTLGEVLVVVEGGAVSPLEGKVAAGLGGMGRAADVATPISPGEVQVTYQVQVTYAVASQVRG